MTNRNNEKTRHHIVLMYCLDELIEEIDARAPDLHGSTAYREAMQALAAIRRRQQGQTGNYRNRDLAKHSRRQRRYRKEQRNHVKASKRKKEG